MQSYQDKDSHYEDKTSSQPSYLYTGNPDTKKDFILKNPTEGMELVYQGHVFKNILA